MRHQRRVGQSSLDFGSPSYTSRLVFSRQSSFVSSRFDVLSLCVVVSTLGVPLSVGFECSYGCLRAPACEVSVEVDAEHSRPEKVEFLSLGTQPETITAIGTFERIQHSFFVDI